MLSDDDAKLKLKILIKKYVADEPEKERLLKIIDDPCRPGLPVRGVFEKIKLYKNHEYSDEEKKIISDLIYMYG